MIRSDSPIIPQESDMMERAKRQAHHACDSLEKMRLLCMARGAAGLLRLGRVFRRLDNHDKDHINFEQFKCGLDKMGLELSNKEVEDLFKRFDTENSGTINMSEVLHSLRPPMSDSRLKDIEAAFNKLDKHGHGEITIDDLHNVYNVKSLPLYNNGEVTEEQFLKKFISNFEQDAIKDGKISKEEFINYYSGISATAENDAFFDLVMRQPYKL